MVSPMLPAELASPTLPEGAGWLEQTDFMPGRKLTAIDLVGGIFCSICQSTFANKKDYDSHYVVHDIGNTDIGYTCVVCRKQFSNYPSFRNHCYLIHSKTKHKCIHCSKTFLKRSILSSHIDITHNFKCEPCQKQFVSKKELKTHQAIHSLDKPPYKCQECGEIIESIDMCEFHIDEHCTALYSCPICNDKTTNNKLDAAKHLMKHFGEVILDKYVSDNKIGEDSSIDILGGVLCNYCDELFKNRLEFDTHFATEHGDLPLVYSCNICRKQYDKYLLFSEHCYNHMTKGRFECTDCGKTFPRLSLLVTHTEAYHLSGSVEGSVEKPFLCGECGRSFKAPNRLRTHMRVVHKTNTMRCTEEGCDMLFSSLKKLLLHQRSHRSERDNWCRHCGLQFSSFASCERHLDVHRKKHYACPVCRRSYKEKHLMLKHIPSHFESVLHVCKQCGKAFNLRSRLVQHSKTHSDIRAHKCTVCNKGFIKASILQQHMNFHTGSKPYKCSECSKAFTNHSNCHKHMRRMHKLEKRDISKKIQNQAKIPPELPLSPPVSTIDNHDAIISIESGIDSLSSEQSLEAYTCTELDDSTMDGLEPMVLQKELCISNESSIIDDSQQYTDMLLVNNTIFEFEVSHQESAVLTDAEVGSAVLLGCGPEFTVLIADAQGRIDPLPTSLPTPQHPAASEPLINKVCRVCLALDVKMYALRDTELKTMFQNITGITLSNTDHAILGNVCWECAARLKAATTFRSKALLSDSLLQDLINTGEQVQKNDITTIKEKSNGLITATTLTAIEAFHIVNIEEQNITQTLQSDDDSNQLSRSEIDDIEIINKEIKDKNNLRDDETENRIIKEENTAMNVVILPESIKTEIEDDPTCSNTGVNVREENTVIDDKVENSITEEENTVMDVEETEINFLNKTEIEDYPTCSNTGENVIEENTVMEDKIENSIIKEENTVMDVEEGEINVLNKTEIEDDPTCLNTGETIREENTVMDDKIENSIIEEENTVMDVEEGEINVLNKTEIEDDPTCLNTGETIREENTVVDDKIENSISEEENTVMDVGADEINVHNKTIIEDNPTSSKTAERIKEENKDSTFLSEDNTLTSYPLLDSDILLETRIKIQEEDPIDCASSIEDTITSAHNSRMLDTIFPRLETRTQIQEENPVDCTSSIKDRIASAYKGLLLDMGLSSLSQENCIEQIIKTVIKKDSNSEMVSKIESEQTTASLDPIKKTTDSYSEMISKIVPEETTEHLQPIKRTKYSNSEMISKVVPEQTTERLESIKKTKDSNSEMISKKVPEHTTEPLHPFKRTKEALSLDHTFNMKLRSSSKKVLSQMKTSAKKKT